MLEEIFKVANTVHAFSQLLLTGQFLTTNGSHIFENTLYTSEAFFQVPSSLRAGNQDPALPWAPLPLQDEENTKLLLNDFWCNTILFSPFIRLDPLYWYVRLQLACYAQLSFLFWLVFSINTVRFLIFFQMCPISIKLVQKYCNVFMTLQIYTWIIEKLVLVSCYISWITSRVSKPLPGGFFGSSSDQHYQVSLSICPSIF